MPIEGMARRAVDSDTLDKLVSNMEYGQPPIVADIVSDYPPEYQHPEEAPAKEPHISEIQQDLAQALLNWREAKPGSSAERRAARMLAYRSACLLRMLGYDI